MLNIKPTLIIEMRGQSSRLRPGRGSAVECAGTAPSTVHTPTPPSHSLIYHHRHTSARMTDNAQNGNSGSGGGFHLPHNLAEISDVFHHRHHPARPVPHRKLAAEESHPVPTPSFSGLTKYFFAGALCATITHVLSPSIAPPQADEAREWQRRSMSSRRGFRSILR
jgi:hypothetical protein